MHGIACGLLPRTCARLSTGLYCSRCNSCPRSLYLATKSYAQHRMKQLLQELVLCTFRRFLAANLPSHTAERECSGLTDSVWRQLLPTCMCCRSEFESLFLRLGGDCVCDVCAVFCVGLLFVCLLYFFNCLWFCLK